MKTKREKKKKEGEEEKETGWLRMNEGRQSYNTLMPWCYTVG